LALAALLPAAVASAAGDRSPTAASARASTESNSIAAQTIVPYQAPGYKYLQVSSGQEPPGWQGSAFDDSIWATGDAAFGSGGGCPLQPTVKTHWDPNTNILIRKPIVLPAGASSVTVSVAVDNNVNVYWNGTLVGSATHEFCPAYNDFVFTVPNNLLGAGTNLLAVEGIDTGFESFLDVSVAGNVGVSPTLGNPHGRVIEASFGSTTSPEVVASFTDSGSSLGQSYSAQIDWGDPMHPSQATGSLAPVSRDHCTFLGATPSDNDTCYIVVATHSYARPGTFIYTVTITKSDGQPSITARGIAEVVGSGQTDTPAIGDLTYKQGGQVYACTATVVPSPGRDLILTAAHCFGSLAAAESVTDIEFAPAHKGPCYANGQLQELLQCGGNPYGVWTGNFLSLDPRFAGEQTVDYPFDAAFITLNSNPAGQAVENIVGSIPINFFINEDTSFLYSAAPTGEAWTAYAYAARVMRPTAQDLHTCRNRREPNGVSLNSDHVAIEGCTFDFPFPANPAGPSGSSGGPFVNSANTLPNSIGAIVQNYYPPNNFYSPPQQVHGLAMTLPVAQLYLVAALP